MPRRRTQGRPAGTVFRRSPDSRTERRRRRRRRSSRRARASCPRSPFSARPSGRRRRLARPGARPEPDHPKRRGGAVGTALLAPRLQPLPRSRRLPGGEAALGHAQRHRPRTGARSAGRSRSASCRSSRSAAFRPRAPRTTAARSSPPAGLRLHRRDEGREVPRLRQEHRDACCGRPRCRQAGTPRLPRTRSTAGSTWSSPPAAERWVRNPAIRTSRLHCRATDASGSGTRR